MRVGPFDSRLILSPRTTSDKNEMLEKHKKIILFGSSFVSFVAFVFFVAFRGFREYVEDAT